MLLQPSDVLENNRFDVEVLGVAFEEGELVDVGLEQVGDFVLEDDVFACGDAGGGVVGLKEGGDSVVEGFHVSR